MSRAVFNSLLPSGAYWEPAPLDDYDVLFDGIAENSGAVKADVVKIKDFRNPLLTVILDELEKDYGVVPPEGSTEEQRRDSLKSFMFSRSTTGAYDVLEQKLQDAGFDVFVHVNSPAVDPALFLDFENTASQLIINDPILIQEYLLPANPGYWSQIFFVGGEATRDGGGSLTSIDFAGVDANKRRTLKDIILKHKPLLSWGAYVEEYTQYLDGVPWLDGTWYLDGDGREVV